MRANTAVRQKQNRELRLVKKSGKKSVDINYFKIFTAASVVFTVIALGQVIQYSFYNQYSFENQKLNNTLVSIRQSDQEMESRITSLESPTRVERIAKDKLKMVKPEQVGYIIYEAGENGINTLAMKR